MASKSRKKGGRTLVVAAALLPGLGAPLHGAYADANAEAADAPREGVLAEITVTANKRAENMQQVPIAISAVTADAAAALGVVNGQTLAQVIPGLQLNRQTNGSTPFLRGVGSPSTQAGTEPAVAMYVDDVYYGSSAAQLTNYNSIDRIEVLKGPQGTLFGRNATGGVISVYTKNPSRDPEYRMSVGYASYQTVSGSFYASGPVSDTLSANLSVYGEKQHEGWGDNFTTGRDSYRQNNYGGRAKLLWEPGDDTSVLVNVDYDEYWNQQAVYFRPSPGTLSSAGALSQPPPDRYDTFENIDPIAAVDMYGGSVKVDHDFGSFGFVSISAYRNSEATQYFAQDGSRTFRLNPLLVYNTDTFTQEFQFLSPADARIAWVAGLYYLNDKVIVDPFEFQGALAGGGLSRKGAGAEQKTDSYSAFAQATIPVLEKANVTVGARYTTDDRSLEAWRVNTSSAGVASPRVFSPNSGVSESWSNWTGRVAFDYQFTDDFMAYVAWNRGFKSGVFNTILAPSFAPPTPTNPIPTPPPAPIDPPANPEEIDAFTIGFKSEFLDGRMRLNAEAFYYDYKNLQLQQVFSIPGGGTATFIGNAAKATLQGLDVALTWKPVEQLTVDLGVEFLDGEYDDFPNGQFFYYDATPGGNCSLQPNSPVPNPAPTAAGCNDALIRGLATAPPPNYVPNANPALSGTWNLKGNETIQTPPLSATLSVTYTVPLAGGSLDLVGNWYHSGDYFADPDNGLGQLSPSSRENNRQDELDVLNASVTWRSGSEKYLVRLWGKNLTDEEYWSFANTTGTMIKETPAPPLTYGVTFETRF